MKDIKLKGTNLAEIIRQVSEQSTAVTASNHLDVSFYNALSEANLLKDKPSFSSIDLSEYKDIDALIVHVALTGSGPQKIAVGRLYDDEEHVCN